MQRPLLLKGHERPLTTVCYNREGDLLFTAAKDPVPCVWYSHNGERVGTYKGHSGAVYSLDVDRPPPLSLSLPFSLSLSLFLAAALLSLAPWSSRPSLSPLCHLLSAPRSYSLCLAHTHTLSPPLYTVLTTVQRRRACW